MHRQLTFDQACERLRIPAQVLRDAVKYNEVPHRKQGDAPIFDAAELDTWGSRRILALQLKDLTSEHAASTRKNAQTLTDDILLPLLLRPEFIDIDFRAKTRKSVMRDLVDKAEALELLYDPTDLLAQIEQREAASSTALPGGIALLHPHHPDPYLIAEPFMLLARTSRPVWFGAEDDAPTDIFCLICCGENLQHLHVLARLCMMIRDTDVLQKIRAAQSDEEVTEIVYAAERDVLMRLR